MKKSLSILCATLMALLSSCDKDATNIKLEKVTGTYNGDILASLYMPDYNVEQSNILLNENSEPSLTDDTIRNGKLELYFSNNDEAHFSMKNLSGVKFRIPYILYHYNKEFPEYNYAEIRDIYAEGVLARVYGIVSRIYVNSFVNAKTQADSAAIEERFYKFVELASVLEDTVTFRNIECEPLQMREVGATITSYDYEQNSYYERIRLKPFEFTRKSNISSIIAYIEANYSADLTADDRTFLASCKDKIVSQGTVSDATGWCLLSYSNYSPRLEMTIDNASGILDVLTTALFGQESEQKQLRFEIDYYGNIDKMDSYELVK